jgi:glycerol uptake facilitator-like aquaporin
MHAILPVKGSSDWSYAWVPVVGPIVGAAIAAGLHMALPISKKNKVMKTNIFILYSYA